MANEVNREYKSSLFSYMLSQKEYALQVYNALNDSNYDNPKEVKITTLENVVFINIKNDVSLMLNNTFNLYEHQSTYNPNMPLRSLFYLSNSFEKLIKIAEANLYGTKLVKIPTPKCVVFYNGDEEYPDKQILKLSDSFENKNIIGDLELTVTMLNINYSHNNELLEKCEVLRGYSLYNEKFREYNKNEGITKTEAANMAIDYCISNKVMTEFFIERRNEVVGMILEYTAEQAEKDIANLERKILESEQKLAAKEQKLVENEQKLAAKEQKLVENEQKLAAKEQKLVENEQKLAESEHTIAELREEIEKLKQLIS